ncbi:hypothetical protein [Tropicimonas marinistellae]|uniref:hypothetical protein n=1 Tax=Tropicimonas marinistellae TaxID=1739787 RepID=UPI0008377D50|nr:hypothetical protein [Tropicimonas marinistellae]
MTNSIRTALLLSGSLALLAGTASAHTPLCACYDNGDGTVLCEGGFSDGSSAANVPMIVRDASGEALLEGVIDANGEFEFEKPEGFHDVLFDGGEGHQIVVPQDEIY